MRAHNLMKFGRFIA